MNEKFARWDTLLLQKLKRDWKKMLVWIFGLGLFASGFVPVFEEIAKGEGAAGMFETLQNPAMISIVGPTPIELASDYTVGAMYGQEMLLVSALFAMILSILHVVSHTRKEEELGLTELVRSFQVGRQANSLAVIAQTVLINSLLALLIAGVMIGFGVETITVSGSLLFGASVGMAGLLGAVLALLMAQIMPSSSGATGASLGVVGLMYIVRAGTDVANVNLSMLNPVGWIYLTYPFVENNGLPLLYTFLFSLIVVIVSFSLEGARDMGSGYLSEREGRAHAKKSLLSVPGLLIRLNRGPIISWLVGFVVLGIAYGSIYGDMQAFLESNELIEQTFTHAGVSIEESFTATIMAVMIALVAILPILIINKLYQEESRSYLSQLYATKVTRGQFYWSSIGLAIVSGLVGILLAAGGLGGAAIAVMEEGTGMSMNDFLASGYNFLPSVLFFIGLASLALGWKPQLGKVVYAYLGYSFILNYFGGILDFPDWFSKTAILNWIPLMPIEEFEIVRFIAMTVIGLIMMVVGYIGYQRRDLLEGA